MQYYDPNSFKHLNNGPRTVPGRLDHLDPLIDGHLRVRFVIWRINGGKKGYIHAEGILGHGLAFSNFFSQVFGRWLGESCKDAEPACVAHGRSQLSVAYPLHATLHDRNCVARLASRVDELRGWTLVPLMPRALVSLVLKGMLGRVQRPQCEGSLEWRNGDLFYDYLVDNFYVQYWSMAQASLKGWNNIRNEEKFTMLLDVAVPCKLLYLPCTGLTPTLNSAIYSYRFDTKELEHNDDIAYSEHLTSRITFF